MDFNRIQERLRLAADSRLFEVAFKAGMISEADSSIGLDELTRRGALTGEKIAKLKRWARDLDRSVLIVRRLGDGLPAEVEGRLEVPGTITSYDGWSGATGRTASFGLDSHDKSSQSVSWTQSKVPREEIESFQSDLSKARRFTKR